MEKLARQVAREVRIVTRREVITKAIDGQLSWVAAADILAITPRQMRRIKRAIEAKGWSAVMDQRGGRPWTVAPAQPEGAFMPLAGIDLELLLSIRHEFQ